MSADRKNLSRFSSRIAVGHGAVGDAVTAAGESPEPRDLLSRLAPFAIPVTLPAMPVDQVPHMAQVPPAAQVPPLAHVPALPVAPVVTAPHPRAASPAPQERDVLRAPRPNRPIAGPAVQRASLRSRLSRPAVVAVVGLSVLLGAAGIGVAAAQLTRQTPPTLPPLAHPVVTTPAATATTSPPSPAATTPAPVPRASGDAAWVAVMTQLDGVRDAAFIAADPSALDRVYVDGSSAGIADRAAMSKLRDTGVRADGLALAVHEVRFLHRKGDRVVLRVVDDLPSYRLVGEHGDTVRTEPARATASWRITLELAPAGWRISTIERATSPN